MASQYTDTFLNNNGRYTISTFLAYNLKGKAKSYGRFYEQALLRDLETRVLTGAVERCKSTHGGVSYRRTESK